MASNGRWIWVEDTAPAPETPATVRYPETQPTYYYPQHQQHPHIRPSSVAPSYDYPIASAAFSEAAAAAFQPRVTENAYPPLASYYEDGRSAQYYPYAAEAPPARGAVPPAPRAVAVSASSSYYNGAGGGGAGPSHVFLSREVLREQISVPLGYDFDLLRPTRVPEPSMLGHARSQHWKSKGLRPNSKPMKKSVKQFTKIVQPACCEVCKITCDTQEVLMIHKQGKKHKKKLQMLQASITPKPTTVPDRNVEKVESSDANKEIISPEPSKKKDLPASGEELEAKKRRVLEGGAAEEKVKVCTVCNVVVNSPTVLRSHLAGQKHANMLKKQQELQALSST